MSLLRAILLLLPLAAFAERFSLVHHGDIHASFGSSKNLYATNTVPWILSHTNDGTFNVAGVLWTGDCYEDTSSISNGYDPGNPVAPYATVQLTNDARILAQSGLLYFVTDGNHDANNTNNTYGGTCYTHGAPIAGLAWNEIFPPSLWTNQSYYVTNKDAGAWNNMVMKFDRGTLKLKLISYHTDASTNSVADGAYTNQTEWIRQQMRVDPDYNVLVLAHYFLGQSASSYFDIAPSYTDHNQTYSNFSIGPGRAPVDNGLLSEPNLLGFVSGHNLPLMKGIYLTNAADGHQVFFVQFNTQQSNSGQNGDWLNLLTFDTAKGWVECGTYAISENRWATNYETATTFTNRFFPGGFRHTFTVPLPKRPPTYPVWRIGP